MDIKWTYGTGGVPSRDDIERWAREFQLFSYQPPDPNAVSEARRRGWGFHPSLTPPVDCFEYIAANLKRLWKVRLDDPFRPEAKYSLLTTLTTYFAWLRTEPGTMWLLALYGIRIMRPHPGMAYLYKGERLVEPHFDLRIYDLDPMNQTAKSPDEFYGPQIFGKLQKMLEEARGPAPHPCKHAGEGLWKWVGTYLRNWLVEKESDRDWPTSKPDRISGYTWAKGVLRPGSQTQYVWTILGQTDVYRDTRLYRIQRPAYEIRRIGNVDRKVPPQNPGVLWLGRGSIAAVPLDDFDKHEGVAIETVEARYRCSSCGDLRCCTAPVGRDQRLCMNCRGTQLESDTRPSLKWCQYRECRHCPEHLRDVEDYVNLVSRLNTSSERVHRAY